MSDSFLFVLLEINGLTVFQKFLLLIIPDPTFVNKILFDSFPSEFYTWISLLLISIPIPFLFSFIVLGFELRPLHNCLA